MFCRILATFAFQKLWAKLTVAVAVAVTGIVAHSVVLHV